MNLPLPKVSFSHCLFLFLLAISISYTGHANQGKYEECLLREIQNATGDMRVNDLKDACTPEALGTVEPVSKELLQDEKKEQKVAAVDRAPGKGDSDCTPALGADTT